MNTLKEKHPILSRIPEWLTKMETNFLKRYDKEYTQADVLLGISEKLSSECQESFLFKKHLEVEDELQEYIEENTYKVPSETYEWSFRIWRPSKWIITENDQGKYSVNKYKTVRTTSAYPGWRFVNMGMRVATFINNGLYRIVSNMIFGPFGFRSLVGLQDYQPDRTVNSETGLLEPTGRSFTTWFGRIKKLWNNIRQSRVQFETSEDSGFFGKSFTRPFNWAWNYICKGVFGTFGAVLLHPIFAIGNSIFSLVLEVTSPVWALGGALARYLFDILIFDFDNPNDKYQWFPLFQAIFKDFLVKGLGQFIGAPLVSLAYVLIGVLGYTGSLIRYSLRSFWDYLMFYLFIKTKGRIPNRNGFVAQRTKGPGLSMDYYQEIPKDMGLVMIQHEMEMENLELFRKHQLDIIGLPLSQLKDYYSKFESVGLKLDSQTEIVQRFQETKRELTNTLDTHIRHYKEQFVIRGNCDASHVRFSTETLATVIREGVSLCEEFYNAALSDFVHEDTNYWSSKELIVGDFEGLCKWYLKKAFGCAILQPLEETDASGFRLDIRHVDLKEYAEMIFRGEPRDDLDKVIFVEAPVENMEFPTTSDYHVVDPENFKTYETVENYIQLV